MPFYVGNFDNRFQPNLYIYVRTYRMNMPAAFFITELIPNRNLRASKDCEFRLCRDGLDEAGATRVATELVQHVSGMAETQPLCGKALLRLFENSSVPRYSYRASVAVPK
jgi:hypothetical protein